MKKILMLMVMMGLLTACGGGDEPTPPTPPTPARRTVVVYVAAENNLSPDSYTNLQDMITGRRQVADDENLVVFVDRANATQLPFIVKVTKNESQPLDTLYKYTEDFYTSDPERFREVLQRIVGLCPATEDYGLVLWGHADGWIIESDAFNEQPTMGRRKAYGVDNGNNQAVLSGKWMNIPAMRQALEQLLPLKWKFIFCDCCNMQNAEVAYELREVADYIIASPAEITGIGAPYATIVKDLFIHDDVQMYTAVCTDYHAQKTSYMGRGDEHLPISTVKTDKMEALATATRNILPAIADYVKTTDAMDGLIYYYSYEGKNSIDGRIMYDMNDVIRKALGSDSQAYQDWKAVFDEAVLSSMTSSLWHAQTVNFNAFTVTTDWNERQGVISMFFPLEQYNRLSKHHYNTDIKQMQWYQAVDYQAVGW